MSPKTATQVVPVTAPAEDAFYISATQSACRPRRTLKHNDTFIVCDSHGDIGQRRRRPTGCSYCDTRFLSRLELLVNDAPPLLLGSNLRDDNASLAVDLTNPDVMSDQHIVLEKDTVHILRTIFLWREPLISGWACATTAIGRSMCGLSILFANDFADLFEVRGTHRERRGTQTAQVRGNDQVC